MDFIALIILGLLEYFTFYSGGYTINENKDKEYLVNIAKYLFLGVIVFKIYSIWYFFSFDMPSHSIHLGYWLY